MARTERVLPDAYGKSTERQVALLLPTRVLHVTPKVQQQMGKTKKASKETLSICRRCQWLQQDKRPWLPCIALLRPASPAAS